GDTSAASSPLAVRRCRIRADHQRWTMKLTGKPGSNNANDARMPVFRTHNNRRLRFQLEQVTSSQQRFFEGLLFNRLPITVLPVQRTGEISSNFLVLGQEQVKRVLGDSKSAGRIQARSDSKANMSRPDRRRDTGQVHQGAQ